MVKIRELYELQEVNLNTISELAKEGRIDTSQLITMKTLVVRISNSNVVDWRFWCQCVWNNDISERHSARLSASYSVVVKFMHPRDPVEKVEFFFPFLLDMKIVDYYIRRGP